MPSYGEVAGLMGYASKNSAYYLVSKLIKEGLLARDQTGKLLPMALDTRLPLLGTVPAGAFGASQDDIADTITLVEHLVPNKEATYALIVEGDSMIEAGIMPGDVVLFERRVDCEPGNIVIIRNSDGYTMKYFRIKNGRPYLSPANKRYQPFEPEDGEIIGIVTGQFRKYQ